jgi:integrase
MPRRIFVANIKPSRTEATVRAYLKGGGLLLARAQKKMAAGPGDVIDAFKVLFSDPDLVLRPATTRQYKQQVRAVIGYKLHAGELERDRAVSGLADLTALLKDRRGPCPKRTSRAKLKAPTKAEYLQICHDFNRRWRLAGGLDDMDTVLALMVALGPYLGLRPVEWLNTTILGNKMIIANAKSTNRRSVGKTRSILLDHFPDGIGHLVEQLIVGLRRLFDELEENWRRLLGRLGERLARVCARLGTRRWSLYTTRHVAMANWKRAGFGSAEIAALAGHISTRTARNHYAGGRHGWSAKFACARPDPDLATSISLRNNTTLIPPMVSVSAEANKLDVIDATATVERPLEVKLNQRRADAPPAEGEITLTPFGNDNSDEVPAFGMR